MQTGTDPETGWPVGVYETVGDGEIRRDANGLPVLATTRVFDPARFTNAWLDDGLARGDLAARAFEQFYGRAHSEIARVESHRDDSTWPPVWESHAWLDTPALGLDAWTGTVDGDLVALDLDRPPRLNDDRAVGFDPQLGWVTARENLYEKRSAIDTALSIAAVAFVGWATAGAATAAGWGAVGSAAAAGAAASFAGGAINGNLSLKGVLIGAVSGALTAGLTPGLTSTLKDAGLGAAAGIAARMTVQGGIQALLGGKFKDGAIAGFASGLADLASANIGASIKQAVEAGTMTAGEALAARSFNTMLSSAIRAAGSPGDPAQAFAQYFLGSLMQEHLPASAVQPAPATDPEVVRTFPVPTPAPVDVTPLPEEGQTAPAPIEPVQPPADLPALKSGIDRLFQYSGPGSEAFRATLSADGAGDIHVQLDDAAALVKDAAGRLRYTAASSLNALPAGWQVVAGPGETVMAGATGVVVLPAHFTVQERTLAAVLSQAGTALEGWSPSAAEPFNAPAWLRATVRGSIPTLALTPTEIGGGAQVSEVSSDVRVVRPGMDVLRGDLEIRLVDKDGQAQWVRVTNAASYTPEEVRAMLPQIDAHLRRDALTPEQIAELGRPLIYVPAAPSPSSPPPSMPPVIEVPIHSGAPIDGIRPPLLEGFPIHWLDPEAGILTRDGNADGNRVRARDRQAANPGLADPEALMGTSIPNVGTWIAPETHRSDKGADYEEQVTGVPSGMELNVGGSVRQTSSGTVTASGGANFDGVRVEADGTVVLLDAKDWEGMLLPEQQWWNKSINDEAFRQVNAIKGLGGGARIEWVVPTPRQAEAIAGALERLGYEHKIDVVVAPKEGS